MSRTTPQRGAGQSNAGRPKCQEEPEKGLWSSILDSVATGRRLPEKTLIVLGGTTETQREFLESLESDALNRPQNRHKKKPVVVNNFALGYTYQDVLDADHEDILARLSVYLLSEPSPSYSPLLKPLLTPQAIPEALLVILLDWNEPWSWLEQLRDWIGLIRSITASLSEASKQSLDETMKGWQERRAGTSSYDAIGASTSDDANITIPHSQGEWDEPLGLPLCVVCQHANNINTLEIERNWREEDFDFILQSLRTVLMKHGASLIYTSPSVPNSLLTLIHSSLNIHSTLKRQALKHNVIDREKILVPPNWDSWGKIRVIREGFDVEGFSSKWGIDISQAASGNIANSANTDKEVITEIARERSPVVSLYESTISDPHAAQKAEARKKPGIDVSVPTMQTFLIAQQETLARLAAEDERLTTSGTSTSSSLSASTAATSVSTHGRMADQIGPVQVNMGGIQVDADDVVRKLQSQTRKDPTPSGKEDTELTPKSKGEGANLSTPDMKAQNDALRNFFSGLTKRTGSNTSKGTPSKSGPKDDAK